MTRIERLMTRCQCGTGNYCKKHQRYDLPERKPDLLHAGRERVENVQPCGGGFRILRSAGAQ